MKKRTLSALGLGLVAWTAPAASASEPRLDLSYRDHGDEYRVTAYVTDAFGPGFRLFARNAQGDLPDGPPHLVGVAPLDADGNGSLTFSIPAGDAVPPATRFAFSAVLGRGVRAGSVVTETIGLDVPCELLDFDFVPGNVPAPPAGAEPQGAYSEIGLQISGQNNTPGAPDKALYFNSNLAEICPSSGDQDLQTPGFGPGNDFPLGKLLIVPDNDVDADGDGLVDCPGDDNGGGQLVFEWTESVVRVCFIDIVDVDDDNQSRAEFFNGDELIANIPIPNGGNNSRQRIFFDVFPVTRMDVVFGGSGGIGDIGLSVCPTRVDFDETTTGVPLFSMAEPGTQITDQLLGQGVSVDTLNFSPLGPDVAILFDASNPTGEDFDLLAGGGGPGNDDPSAVEGEILIIAEDVVDANMDDLVDDPDDEARGGVIGFDFTEDVVFLSARVMDVDADENSFIELFDDDGFSIAVLLLEPLGNNSLQTVGPPLGAAGIQNVARMELHLGEGSSTGSGALVDFEYCPQVIWEEEQPPL